jgi:hypothetical protein
LIDLSERLDQVDGVGFIAGELGSDGMRVNSDVHGVRIPIRRDRGRLIFKMRSST